MTFRNLNSISLKNASTKPQISESSGYNMQGANSRPKIPPWLQNVCNMPCTWHARVARAVESASRLKLLWTRQPPPLANDTNGYPFDGHISKGFTYTKNIEIARMDTQNGFEILGCSLNSWGSRLDPFWMFRRWGVHVFGSFLYTPNPCSKVFEGFTTPHNLPF